MSDTSIEERVKKVIIDQLNVTADKLASSEVRFVDDLGADSLDQVELIMALEEEFQAELDGADIPEEEAEKLQTLGSVLDYIQAKVG